MAYKGPHILDVPPSWTTLDELRDNLVEYMMLQSPYKDLAKEDMPPEMVKEMEKSMTRMAIAIYHDVVGEGGGGTWDVYLNNKKQETVNALQRVVNFVGKGITIKWEDREDGQTLIWSLGADDMKDIVDAVIDAITPVPKNKQWVETGTSFCEVVDGYNTGQLMVEKKEQIKVGETDWEDTGTVQNFPTQDQTTCPVLAMLLAVSTGQSYNYGNEVILGYATGTSIAAPSPTLAGYNYFFISAPASKSLSIRNAMNIDVTSNFSVVGTDNRTGYRNNNIYRGNNVFATSRSVNFYLTLS